jgi:hypothetical protein
VRDSQLYHDILENLLIIIGTFSIHCSQGKCRDSGVPAAAWLGIPIFGSNFWDLHQKQKSISVIDSGNSGQNFFLKFQCLESQKIEIPICKIWNSGNLFVQELTTLFRC